ncbi:MAG: hypothetical protein KDJ29_17415 [Hyphomicrobiales bacterium]|nr:hypothetical protein [Hyphomicrobiales bacterium]
MTDSILLRNASRTIAGTAGAALAVVAGLFLLIAMPAGIGVRPAAAQSSCQIDFGILQKKRMTHINALNKSVKRNKGKLDPRTACPRLRNLAAVEREMVTYMKKNKSWCQIPDDPINQMASTSKKTAAMAGKACRAVAMARKAAAAARRSQNQNLPQRPKLPSGPL